MIELELIPLALAYLFVVVALIIVRARGIGREKELLLATSRMTLQLIITGYALTYIIEQPHPLFTLGMLLLMEGFAIRNIFKRAKRPLNKSFKKIIGLSIGVGTSFSILFFLFGVVGIKPWYNPRYAIPISGMLIGNSMTGISLGVVHLSEAMYQQKDRIEAALMMGASPKMATHQIVNEAFASAILPTVNSMMGIGIVFLPGMMTGQILSGVSPLVAIKYQIAIMLGILGSVTLTVLLFSYLGYRTFFDKQRAALKQEQDD